MNAIKKFGQLLLRTRVPLPIFLIPIVLLMGFTYLQIFPKQLYAEYPKKDSTNGSSCVLNVHQIRLNNYTFTKPLILTDIEEKQSDYKDLEAQLEAYVNEKKVAGDIESAGIYLRRFNGTSPITVNADQSFNPGSVAKISILMTYLKMAQNNPKLMETTYSLNPGEYSPIQQMFPSQEIEIGKKYSVKILLYFMIVKSANSATALLTKNMDQKVFENLFIDLGLPEVSSTNSNYQMSASGVSRFMRVLYNSSYLTPEASEFALDLLSKAEFADGICNALPKGQKLAHKFGEQGDSEFKQLHETAIIYLDNIAYNLTVMTKGKDMKKLSNFISGVSKIAYNRFNTNI